MPLRTRCVFVLKNCLNSKLKLLQIGWYTKLQRAGVAIFSKYIFQRSTTVLNCLCHLLYVLKDWVHVSNMVKRIMKKDTVHKQNFDYLNICSDIDYILSKKRNFTFLDKKLPNFTQSYFFKKYVYMKAPVRQDNREKMFRN